ncbi:MAG: tRNA (guanosine(46)-N7)-methyltransferase TrmB [Spirochaetia bacterium]|jgi:tRNA (guanine-N7-)-methyltransferase|nr:tRNA (guanosine(46)-N7)-methyltransferase TrmB [Spirochaetia bacterium]
MQEDTRKGFRSIKSFVLRAGRLTKAQKNALENSGPRYMLDFSGKMFEIGSKGAGFLSAALNEKRKIIAEIGFGNGDALALMAERNRGSTYLGIEVYLPGVGNLLKLIEEKKLENIRIVKHDAVEVIEALKGRFKIDGFHIFFPDPWHKKKHNKRRIINKDFTSSLIDTLVPGGYIYAVTDWEDYGVQMQNVFSSFSTLKSPFKGFVPYGNNSQDVEKSLLPWRPETRFENKGFRKNHSIYESFFIKKPGKPL